MPGKIFTHWCIRSVFVLPLALIFNSFISMQTGTVKFFDETKGYGFIRDEETNKEVFVHVSGLIDKITADDRVTYDVTEGKKGLNAVNVKQA